MCVGGLFLMPMHHYTHTWLILSPNYIYMHVQLTTGEGRRGLNLRLWEILLADDMLHLTVDAAMVVADAYLPLILLVDWSSDIHM